MVNAYLREIADDDLTAKDFRTWGGTVAAAERLRELGPPSDAKEAEANVLDAIDTAAERLGNTRAVCRASYLDPRVPKAYRYGRFDEVWDDDDREVDGSRRRNGRSSACSTSSSPLRRARPRGRRRLTPRRNPERNGLASGGVRTLSQTTPAASR
jgi:hypothetical protein